jgi:iron(III) transport system substrate-binding protein
VSVSALKPSPKDGIGRIDMPASTRPLFARLLPRMAAIAVAACALANPPAAAQTADEWKNVVEAAKKEGSLVVYNGTGFLFMRELADAFEKAYGIHTDVLVGRATEIRERIRAEQASGRFIADVGYNGNTTLRAQVNDGVLQKHAPLPRAGAIEAPLADDGMVVPLNVGSYAILVNSAQVSEADAPKSWADVGDPKWKGKILSDDPRVAGGGQAWFQATYFAFGRSFHEKIAANNPVISRNFQESARRIGRGEYQIYIPFNVSELVNLKGLPVRAVVPREGLPYIMLGFALLRNAPHPNAARLFMNFALEEQAQLVVAREGFRPVVGGLGGKLPAELVAFNGGKLLGTTEPSRTDEMLKLSAEIYK